MSNIAQIVLGAWIAVLTAWMAILHDAIRDVGHMTVENSGFTISWADGRTAVHTICGPTEK